MAALDLALEFSKAELDGALTQHPGDGEYC